MKYLFLIVFTLIPIFNCFSQVKKQYVDKKSTQTTVVVKEDNANDYEILNSQFDIDKVGIGEVIRIKTEKIPADKPRKEKEKEKKPAPILTPKSGTTKKVVSEKYFKGTGSFQNKNLKKRRKKRRYKNRKVKVKKKRKVLCPQF